MGKHVPLSALADHAAEIKRLEVAEFRHVEECPECTADMRWIERLVQLRKDSPPIDALDEVMRYFQNRRGAA